MAAALLEKGLASLAARNLDAALNAFTEAASAAGSAQSTAPSRDAQRALKIVQGRAFGNLSNIFFGRSDFQSAIMFTEKALRVFEDVGEREKAAISLFNLAVYELKAGNADVARRHMECVLLKTDDPQRVAQANRWLIANGAGDAVLAAAITAAPNRSITLPPALTNPPEPHPAVLPQTPPSPDEVRLLAHARLGHPDEVRALLDRLGASAVDARALHTPLIEACRAPRCSVLHTLTVQLLLHRRATVDAPDYIGMTALMHAALSCSVCSATDCSVDERVGPLAPAPRGAMVAASPSESPLPPPAGPAPLPVGRPRTASDGSPRHLQLVMMLLNAGANPFARSYAGVSALLLLAASPLSEAVAVFTELVGRAATPAAAAAEGGSAAADPAAATAPPWWAPDCRGRNVLHYCARASNAEGARIALQRLPLSLGAQLLSSPDRNGATPAQALWAGDSSVAPSASDGSPRRMRSPKPRRRHSVTSPSATARRRMAPTQQPPPPPVSSGEAALAAGDPAQVAEPAPRRESAAPLASGVSGGTPSLQSPPGSPRGAATRPPSGSDGGAGGSGAAVSPAQAKPVLPQRRSHRFGPTVQAGAGSGHAAGGAGGDGVPLQQDMPPEVRRRQCQFVFSAVLSQC